MPADTLYEDDIVTWAEQQVQAIRELVRARPELSNAIDWENIAEEIETLGRSEWKGVASHLRVALAHILKEVCDPDSLSRQAWAVETDEALSQARDDFRASMHQHIDVDEIWTRAFRQATNSLKPYNVIIPPRIPKQCPFNLDDLLVETFDHASAVAALHGRIVGNIFSKDRES